MSSRLLRLVGLCLASRVLRAAVPRALEIREDDHVGHPVNAFAELMLHFDRWEILPHRGLRDTGAWCAASPGRPTGCRRDRVSLSALSWRTEPL